MSAPSLIQPTTRLPLIHSSAEIPIIGFGVFKIKDKDCTEAVCLALTHKYRLIDTAQIYANEDGVGAGILSALGENDGLSRADIFVTTKIRYPRLGPGKTYLRARDSVRKIACHTKKEDAAEDDAAGELMERTKACVDLFLVHTPHGVKKSDRKEMWLALERLHSEGRARAIGVSNFEVEHIEEMKEYAKIWPPAVNQLQLNPWHQKPALVDYCREHDMVIQAHSPLAQGGEELLDGTVVDIAEKHSKSAAQILIRYSLQKGFVPLPKSEREERIKEDMDVFDFELTEEDMASLDSLT